MIRLLALVCGLLLMLPAGAQAYDWHGVPVEDWYAAEHYDEPGLRASLNAAEEYWTGVPGVPSIESACPNGIDTRIIDIPEKAGKTFAFGQIELLGRNCGVWYERTSLASDLPPRGRLRKLKLCYITIHEVGHTLGLTHDFVGDVGNIMLPAVQNYVPDPCASSYPLPQAAMAYGIGNLNDTKASRARAARKLDDRLH